MTSHMVPYLDDCADRRVIFFTGKGGVGKSTVTWATARALAKRGVRVAVAGWNPFEELATPPWAERFGIRYIPLETIGAFRDYVLQLLKFERIYDAVFDNRVLRTFILAAPGLPETVIAGKIRDAVDRGEQDVLLVDLPASGHALSFFQSPIGIQKIFPFGFVHRESRKITDMFQQRWCRIDLLALPEELPVVECLQLKQKLEAMHPFHFGYLLFNQCSPRLPVPEPMPPVSPEIEATLQRFGARRKQEEEAIGLAWELHLPRVSVPRFPSMERDETLAQVAAYLENA